MSPLSDGLENCARRSWTLTAMLAAVVLGVCILALDSSNARGEPSEREVDRDPEGAPYLAGELLVTYTPEVGAEAKEKVKSSAKGRVDKELPELRAQLLSFPEVKDEPTREARERELEQAKRILEQDPAVEAADYNYLRHAQYTPDDPKFPSQYGLKRPGFPAAWDQTRGAGTKIAVVDGGVAAGHPDLKAKVAAQRDFVDDDGVAQDDTRGHGTHVAGTAAATTGNTRGVAGGCPGCRLLIAKVTKVDLTTSVADEVEGIRWAMNKGAKIINLSLGGAGSVRAEEDAVNYAWTGGAVVVAAAGNAGNSEPFYPAAYPDAVAVAAVDSADQRAPYSNYGDWVDVAAPGTSILSTVPSRGYAYKSGTSMASPHVAALAGLLASQGLSNAEIRSRILETAVYLGLAGQDPYYGAGRIDAARAVR